MNRTHASKGIGRDRASQERTKAILICPRCGRQAERLLPMPIPRRQNLTGTSEPLVCERCLRDLEKEYTREESDTLPPE